MTLQIGEWIYGVHLRKLTLIVPAMAERKWLVHRTQWVYQVRIKSSASLLINTFLSSAVCWIQPLIRPARSLPPSSDKQSIFRLPPHLSHTSYSPHPPALLHCSNLSAIRTQTWRCPGHTQPSWLSSLCFLHFPVSLMQENVGFRFLHLTCMWIFISGVSLQGIEWL